jgi:hypothetical protein
MRFSLGRSGGRDFNAPAAHDLNMQSVAGINNSTIRLFQAS